MKTENYRISGDGLFWYLQQEYTLWFLSWWVTIYTSPFREDVFAKGIELQDEKLKQD